MQEVHLALNQAGKHIICDMWLLMIQTSIYMNWFRSTGIHTNRFINAIRRSILVLWKLNVSWVKSKVDMSMNPVATRIHNQFIFRQSNVTVHLCGRNPLRRKKSAIFLRPLRRTACLNSVSLSRNKVIRRRHQQQNVCEGRADSRRNQFFLEYIS